MSYVINQIKSDEKGNWNYEPLKGTYPSLTEAILEAATSGGSNLWVIKKGEEIVYSCFIDHISNDSKDLIARFLGKTIRVGDIIKVPSLIKINPSSGSGKLVGFVSRESSELSNLIKNPSEVKGSIFVNEMRVVSISEKEVRLEGLKLVKVAKASSPVDPSEFPFRFSNTILVVSKNRNKLLFV